eukprot:3312560-Lingulodinium_polyedra.AAC.1
MSDGCWSRLSTFELQFQHIWAAKTEGSRVIEVADCRDRGRLSGDVGIYVRRREVVVHLRCRGVTVAPQSRVDGDR